MHRIVETPPQFAVDRLDHTAIASTFGCDRFTLTVLRNDRIQMSTNAASAPFAHGIIRPRNVLMAVVLLELVTAGWGFLAGRMSILFEPLEPAGPDIAAIAARIQIAGHPLLVFVALVFVVTGRLRLAIAALGVLEMTRWLNYIVWVTQIGPRLDDALDIQWTVAQVFCFPLMAAGGVALSALDKRLGLATALISAPTFYNLIGVTVFVLWF